MSGGDAGVLISPREPAKQFRISSSSGGMMNGAGSVKNIAFSNSQRRPEVGVIGAHTNNRLYSAEGT